MAKKAKKKVAKSSPKKVMKKVAKKTPAKAKAGPRKISTGSGSNVAELGSRFVELFNARTPDAKIWDELFHKNWSSIEGFGVAMAFDGRKAVEQKCEEWLATHEVHGASCEGPFLGATGFAVLFTMDVTDKNTNQRIAMKEIANYTVKNGKIVQEEFMYGG